MTVLEPSRGLRGSWKAKLDNTDDQYVSRVEIRVEIDVELERSPVSRGTFPRHTSQGSRWVAPSASQQSVYISLSQRWLSSL